METTIKTTAKTMKTENRGRRSRLSFKKDSNLGDTPTSDAGENCWGKKLPSLFCYSIFINYIFNVNTDIAALKET